MEYVRVVFEQDRAVIIDDQDYSRTNKIMRLGAGFHTFTLDGDKDFLPLEITCPVSDTSEVEPMVITFKVNDNE